MGIVESFIHSYNSSVFVWNVYRRGDWNRTIDYWAQMTHDERLLALNRIGKGRVHSGLYSALMRRGDNLEPYRQFFRL